MMEILAPDATYDDPTVVHFDQDAIALVGRETIVEFWRKSSEELDARNIDYKITDEGTTSFFNLLIRTSSFCSRIAI